MVKPIPTYELESLTNIPVVPARFLVHRDEVVESLPVPIISSLDEGDDVPIPISPASEMKNLSTPADCTLKSPVPERLTIMS